MLVLIIGTMAILAFFVTEIFQIRSNHQANLLKINQCFDNDRTTLIEVETSFDHTNVTCSEN